MIHSVLLNLSFIYIYTFNFPSINASQCEHVVAVTILIFIYGERENFILSCNKNQMKVKQISVNVDTIIFPSEIGYEERKISKKFNGRILYTNRQKFVNA